MERWKKRIQLALEKAGKKGLSLKELAGACKKIQRPPSLDLKLDGREDPLLDLVHRGPRVHALRGLERHASGRSCDDSHWVSS